MVEFQEVDRQLSGWLVVCPVDRWLRTYLESGSRGGPWRIIQPRRKNVIPDPTHTAQRSGLRLMRERFFKVPTLRKHSNNALRFPVVFVSPGIAAAEQASISGRCAKL